LVITYFDTSALLPIVIEEPASDRASDLWIRSTQVISSLLVVPEARAGLGKAHRSGRITVRALARTRTALEHVIGQLDLTEVDAGLAHRAGDLAEAHGLRGYDAMHLASAEAINHEDFVFVCGDRRLTEAAALLGINTASTTD
jgi:predicted nucleic acid-binding protein